MAFPLRGFVLLHTSTSLRDVWLAGLTLCRALRLCQEAASYDLQREGPPDCPVAQPSDYSTASDCPIPR